MSLQWTFIATFLYAEIFFTILLLLPFISAYRWSRLFNSRLFNSFRAHANIYFNIFIVVLLVLFLDAIREVRKYSHNDEIDLNTTPNAEVLIHMRLFRAQRNFYIAGFALFLFLYTSEHDAHLRSASDLGHTASAMSDMKMFRAQRNLYISGFALFLWMVLRRMVTLVCEQARNEASAEAMKKQAESASETARQMMEATENKANEKEEKSAVVGELETTKKELSKARDEVTRIQKDLEAMKKQAESTNKEYDRLAEENRSLQQKCEKLEGQEGSKKGN